MSREILTPHALLRLSQRAIHIKDLDLIISIGTEVEGGYLVRHKDCEAAEKELKLLLDRVRRLRGKRVVLADQQIITAYHANSGKQRRLLRHIEERNLRP